ncbi:MAG: TlpA family protein disulfide reductase [Nitrospirae bacterium]|nr:TlpA family protein disulfide reductase [Nitrospirota bacterium]
MGSRREKAALPRAITGLNAPELAVSDVTGKPLSLSDLKGSVVFVNFWATWCDPCREEMPSLQKLYNRFRDQKGFRMVTILYRDDYGKAAEYLKKNGFDFPVFVDNRRTTARSYGVTGVPETYIVDKNGVLKDKVIGPADWMSAQAMAQIAELLKQ